MAAPGSLGALQTLAFALTTWPVFLLFALGVAIHLRVSGFVNLGFAALFPCVPFLAQALLLRGVPGSLALCASLGVVGGGAALIEASIFNRIRNGSDGAGRPTLAGVGLYFVIVNILIMSVGAATRPLSGFGDNASVNLVGLWTTRAQLASVVAGVFLFFVIYAFLFTTQWGRIYRAIASDPQFARQLGFPVDLVIPCASAVGTVLGGLGCTLVALDTAASPTVGFGQVMVGVTCSLIAHKWGWLGLAVASGVMAFVQVVLASQFNGRWTDLGVYAILLSLLTLRGRRSAPPTLRAVE